jgi:hypothetical protein
LPFGERKGSLSRHTPASVMPHREIMAQILVQPARDPRTLALQMSPLGETLGPQMSPLGETLEMNLFGHL